MMPVTSLGQLYARKVHDKLNGGEGLTWPDDVPKRRRQDAYDSYVYMSYTPEIEPPTA